MELMRLMGASEFVGFLATIGVPVTEYGNPDKGSKPLVELWLELVFRQCLLERMPNPEAESGWCIHRKVKVAFLEVQVLVGSEMKILLLKDDTVDGKTRRDVMTRPSAKMFEDEDTEEATWRCLAQTLVLKEKVCFQNFEISSQDSQVEEKWSPGFPGILTVYNMVVLQVRVKDINAAAM